MHIKTIVLQSPFHHMKWYILRGLSLLPNQTEKIKKRLSCGVISFFFITRARMYGLKVIQNIESLFSVYTPL